MPKLIILHGPDAGRQFDLDGPVVTVGRHSANAVPLRDDRVSRRHLEVRQAAGGFQVVDLGSGNGTLLNGLPVKAADLRAGDRLTVGDTVLLFAADPPSTVPRAAAVFPPDAPSAILRTAAPDAGSRILARPDLAATDWLKGRLASLAVLYQATDAISQISDVDDLLARVVDLVVRVADADTGCAALVDPDTGDLVPTAVRGRDGRPGELAVSRTVADHVLATGRGVLVADAAADDRFRAGDSITRHAIREVICVPMRGRHGTVGILFLGGESGDGRPAGRPGPVRFTDDHLTLAVAVGHQAGLAVEHARYHQGMVQAERLAAVGQAIAALSHHIKNIMQGVRFGGDMVRMGLAAADRDLLEKGWKLVEKNQAKIDALILDMLSYAKEREPGVEPTDLNAVAADVLDVVRGPAADAGVELALAAGGGVGAVPCDPDGVHRALLNVVGNAVDAAAAKDGGPRRVVVTTALTADGKWAEVAVDDTGGGIPPDRLGEIFKPFVSTKGARGTGLGLPVSRKVLREHGGDLTAVSTPGVGSRFVLRLPAARPT